MSLTTTYTCDYCGDQIEGDIMQVGLGAHVPYMPGDHPGIWHFHKHCWRRVTAQTGPRSKEGT